jgi:phosphoribosylformimino-5-aminoimidazole carboxamide ribotide isomerase
MRIIGVLDLLQGRAVHARGGQRDRYTAVQSVAGVAIESGDPLEVAHAYVDRLGIGELYAADLDAIRGGRPQDSIIARLAALGVPLWVDAGVSSVSRARHALTLNVARVVVGLETLPSYAALDEICAAVGGDRVAFSLDLRDGEPVIASGGIAPNERPDAIAARAAAAGVDALIVIDLSRVGSSRGVDGEMMAHIRNAAPAVTLVAGGGVRGVEDLAQLAGLGCHGALVATALHDGRITAADVAAVQGHRRSRR